MAIDVSVLRVFTDAEGRYGNPLGVVDAAAVAPRERQALATELGYSETIYVDLPAPGATGPQPPAQPTPVRPAITYPSAPIRVPPPYFAGAPRPKKRRRLAIILVAL